MPPIWTKIEGCKSDRDLRTTLTDQLGKAQEEFGHNVLQHQLGRGANGIKPDSRFHEVKYSHLLDIRNGTEFDAVDAKD